MTVIMKIVSLETYQQLEGLSQQQNFLQSAAMSKVQTDQQRFLNIRPLVFYQGEQVLAQALVLYRKKMRFFTESLILHGPIFHVTDKSSQRQVMLALEKGLKKEGIAKLTIYPYQVDMVRDSQLEILAENVVDKTLYQDQDFVHDFDLEQSVVVNQMFVKNLEDFTDEKEILEAFPPYLKRDLHKFSDTQVKVRELGLEELNLFYQILTETSQRKGFYLQPFSYFQSLKQHFGDQAQFMLAYLDCQAYEAYLIEKITSFEATIADLESKPNSKRTRGAIADAKDQLRSYLKRQSKWQEMGISSPSLPLSAYCFISYGREIVSFSGGSYEEYINFGGSTLIHWDRIRYGKEKGFSAFNFYGTLEVEAASQGKGNFNFKRQFGGQLITLVGSFSKTWNPFLALLEKVKS